MIYTFGGMNYSILKTISSVRFAEYLSSQNRRVLYIDSDPAKKAVDFFELKKNLTILVKCEAENLNEVYRKSYLFDDIVINSGIGSILEKAVIVSDVVITPFSSKDRYMWNLWTLKSIESFYVNLVEKNPTVQFFSFLYQDPVYPSKNSGVHKILSNSKYIKFINNSFFQELIPSPGKTLENIPEELFNKGDLYGIGTN